MPPEFCLSTDPTFPGYSRLAGPALPGSWFLDGLALCGFQNKGGLSARRMSFFSGFVACETRVHLVHVSLEEFVWSPLLGFRCFEFCVWLFYVMVLFEGFVYIPKPDKS